MTDPKTPRIPGVRYRKETRHRVETVEVDGVAETRTVAYTVSVPVPPHDWDQLIVRVLTGTAILVTLLAVTGTTASIGALLSTLVPPVIAYSVAVIFDVTWLACIAVEWLERLDPARARAARTAGWVALVLSMAAVVAFGHHHGETVAGAVGSCVSLLAKGLWTFVLRYYAVPLSEPIRFFLNRRRQRNAVTVALSKELRRMDAHQAYLAAVFGPEAARAHQITASSQPGHTWPGTDTSGQHMSGPSGTVSGQASPPPMPPVPPVPPASGMSADITGHGQDTGQDTVLAFEKPAKAETIRRLLREDPDVSDADLLAGVIEVHGQPGTERELRRLAETVRRTRQRIEKSKAS